VKTVSEQSTHIASAMSGSAHPNHSRLLAPWIVGAATVLTYWPVVSFDFVRWDDDINITGNPLLNAPWSWSLVGQMFTSEHALRFKPLHWLLFRGLRAAFDFNPAAWHVFNLLLHTAAAVLLVVVLRQVFRIIAPQLPQNRIEIAAVLGAVIWTVHPLRAEVVGWATASTYSLTAVGLLASFSCYLRAATCAMRRGRWLTISWLFALAAYASYPVGVTYGLWLMAVDRWLLKADTGHGENITRRPISWVKYAAFLLPAMAAIISTGWSRFVTPGIFAPAPDIHSVGLGLRGMMALASLAWFVRQLLWPIDLTPNVPPLIEDKAMLFTVALYSLAAVAVLYWAWRSQGIRPGFALVAIGTALVGLPCLGWTERPTWPVDRYTYLVDMILVGGLAGALLTVETIRRWRLGIAVAAICAMGCASLARAQLRIWQNSGTLFSHMEQHPRFTENPRQQSHVYLLWAGHEASHGRTARAVELSRRAEAACLTAIHRAIARNEYDDALELVANLERHFTLAPALRREKGAWLLRVGRATEALEQLKMAQQFLPDDPRTRSLLQQVESARSERDSDKR
jgi:hypothetical protein